jgi:hypothetical protein
MTHTFENLTAKIFIKKTKFFGLVKKYAVFVVVPSLVIAKIQTNINNLPFEKLTTLDLNKLLSFVKENGYVLSYGTQNKKLKKILKNKVNKFK